MTIASITTFGFGSYSTVNLAVVLGYGEGGSTTTTGGHFLPKRAVDEYRKNLKFLEKKRKDLEADKLAKAHELRLLLENKGNIPVIEDDEEQELPLVVENKLPQEVKVQARDYRAEIRSINDQIQLMEAKIRMEALLAEQAQEEEDIETILGLLYNFK